MTAHTKINKIESPHESMCKNLHYANSAKGQLISKGQKTNEQIRPTDTSGRLVFVRFLEELKTPKISFEIN